MGKYQQDIPGSPRKSDHLVELLLAWQCWDVGFPRRAGLFVVGSPVVGSPGLVEKEETSS